MGCALVAWDVPMVGRTLCCVLISGPARVSGGDVAGWPPGVGVMVMDRLWAPWRASYIRDASRVDAADQGCFLCRGLESREDRPNGLVWRRPHSTVFLNRYPYNNGHLLVAPLLHRGTLGELSGPDLLEPIETIREAVTVPIGCSDRKATTSG